MKKITFLFSVFAIFFTANILTAAEPVWFTDFAQAQAEARKLKRPILADFTGSDWCGWCVKLDKEVFSQKQFKSYAAKNLVLLTVDFPRSKWQTPAEKKANSALAQKYHVNGFPTVLLLDADGNVIARTGYAQGGANRYVNHLKKLLKK